MATFYPRLAWTGEAFATGQAVLVDAAGELREIAPRSHDGPEDSDERAILPGFVNAHSHAFQIGLRGAGETYPKGRGSFWTWREAMYSLVESMTADRLYELSRQAFAEMLAAGITCVGEFHYLRHLSDDEYDFAGDDAVLAAAHDAGIRIVLLAVYYATGGIGQPLEPAQRRFATPDPTMFWRQIDRLGGRLGPRQSLGIAPHSIRAVPRADLGELYREAQRRQLPVHMHLEEQQREIDTCRRAYGKSPMEIVLEDLAPEGLDGLTAVHCTHTPADQLARFFDAGGRACICPLTEGNLGDGLPQLAEVPGVQNHLCLGTDSNLRISMLEEMRWLEYGQRVRRQERGSIAGDGGVHLIRTATEGGARALAGRGQAPPSTGPIALPSSLATQSGWVYSTADGALDLVG